MANLALVIPVVRRADPNTLILDDALWCRSPDEPAVEDAIDRYADLLRAGRTFPPVKVVGTPDGLLVGDGFLRVRAHVLAGLPEIDVEVTQGTRSDALLISVQENSGVRPLPLSRADKERAVVALLSDPTWGKRSANWIAKTVGVSPHTVKAVAERNTLQMQSARLTSDGRLMNVGNIGREADPYANEWYTPSPIIDPVRTFLGTIDLDPASCDEANRTVCAAYVYTEEDSGLLHPWTKKDGSQGAKVWLNAPYNGTLSPWVEKALAEHRSGNVAEIILLLPVLTSRPWWQPLWQFPICFLHRRIEFDRPHELAEMETTTPSRIIKFDHACVYVGPRVAEFEEAFKLLGHVVLPRP